MTTPATKADLPAVTAYLHTAMDCLDAPASRSWSGS